MMGSSTRRAQSVRQPVKPNETRDLILGPRLEVPLKIHFFMENADNKYSPVFLNGIKNQVMTYMVTPKARINETIVLTFVIRFVGNFEKRPL